MCIFHEIYCITAVYMISPFIRLSTDFLFEKRIGQVHTFIPDLHTKSLRWRHNGHDGVSNHQPQDCLLNSLFGRRSKKTSKFRVTGLREGIHRGPVNSQHKWPVTRKMLPFDDVIMRRIISRSVPGLANDSLCGDGGFYFVVIFSSSIHLHHNDHKFIHSIYVLYQCYVAV